MVGLDVWVRLVLRFAWLRVVEALESGGDVGEHGEVDFVFCVVPVKIEAKVPTAGPIFGNFVIFLEHRHEMICVLFTHVFDAKVVDTEGETDGAPFVGPETWCERALLVAVFVEALLE